jgi:predicted membrane-bound spermidine synthase
MAAIVYALCVLASAVCAILLLRRYLSQRSKLLLWSACAFALLAINNLFVFFDIILFPTTDFSFFRTASSLGAVGTLLYGFIWELD